MYNKFKSFNDIEQYLSTLGLFHMDFGLSRVTDALKSLNFSKSSIKIIQIVGTNGKGSTSTFIEALCREHGLKTGLFTSPHFISLRERILINSKKISDKDFVIFANKVIKVTEKLTYFEFLTVLAIILFVEKGIDVAIMEAGLGGAYDATTALPVDILCFTTIDLDHVDILGNTLVKIAKDKIGAIRDNAIVCSIRQQDDVEKILYDKTKKLGNDLYILSNNMAQELLGKKSKLALMGKYQYTNASLALLATEKLFSLFNLNVDEEKQIRALKNAFIAGRMQYIKGNKDYPNILLDGAHNPNGMKALISSLREENMKPCAIIYASMADKNWQEVLDILVREFKDKPFFIASVKNSRALKSVDVECFLEKNYGICINKSDDDLNLSNILAKAKKVWEENRSDFILITGSLYLLGEFYKLYPRFLEK